nr:MAG TPA: hypothetical protein [Caudoviricetes sp.]
MYNFLGLRLSLDISGLRPFLFNVIGFHVVHRFSTGGNSHSCPGSDRVQLFRGCFPGSGFSRLLNDSYTLIL